MEANFGSCCPSLAEALKGEIMDFKWKPTIFVENDGLLYVSIGYSGPLTDGGAMWYDRAVVYCPFCGTKIQDEATIKEKG